MNVFLCAETPTCFILTAPRRLPHALVSTGNGQQRLRVVRVFEGFRVLWSSSSCHLRASMSSARRTSVSPRGTHRSGSLSPRNGPAKVFSGASLVVGGALDTPPPFASPSRPRQRSKASSSIQSPGQLQPSLHAARRTPSSPRASISKLGPLTGSLDAKDLSVADYIVDSSPIVYDASPAGGGGPGVPMETGAVRRSSPAPYASLGSSGVTSPILSGRKESAVSMSTPPVYPAGRIPSGGGGAILPPGARLPPFEYPCNIFFKILHFY